MSAWTRVFALAYDPFVWAGERAGMERLRRETLAAARGRVLELGAGTGLNLPHYPASVDELVLAEPDAAMRARLRQKLRATAQPVEVVDAPAERLPFADASFDTVVSTLVLCTVDDVAQALSEIARVLRPGGELLFVEHVRSSNPRLAAWQDRLRAPWQSFAAGCRCNRDTLRAMRSAGLVVEAGADAWRVMPPVVRPLAVGRAHAARH